MIMVLVIAVLAVGMVANGAADPKPGHTSAKLMLPSQASDHAQPPSKVLEVGPVQLPPPLPPIPEVISLFTMGQSANEKQATKAIDAATVTVNRAIREARRVSIITMTGTRISLERTRLPPVGRRGDLEIATWRLNDRLGRRIGSGSLSCRWATTVRRLCFGEVRLPRGKLAITGSSQTRVTGQFAVVGGTGVYLFQQGVLTFSALSRNGKYAIRVLLA
jgi:hypothetical protein